MNVDLDQQLTQELKALEQQALYRQRKIIDGPQSVHIHCDGRQMLNFSSNDYLGLANHPDVKKAFQQGINTYGVGSGAAHLVCGHTRVHHELEELLADYTGRSRALLFSTGYMANLGIVNALVNKNDVIFQDKLNHASMIDAALLASALQQCQLKRYPHNDEQRLAQLLAQADKSVRKLVMMDAVYSMDGDCAPVVSMSQLCQQHNAWLMLDDAHGFGVLGKSGAGIIEQYDLTQEQVPIYMATLGKAMGVAGAFVAGSDALIEMLIQKARPYIYTTAMPAAIAQALLCSINLSRRETWRREQLDQNIQHFRQGAEQLNLPLMPSNTAIQPLLLGTNSRALEISRLLSEQGFLITAIRPPTVPKDTARLRVTLSAEHSQQDIEQLLNALSQSLLS